MHISVCAVLRALLSCCNAACAGRGKPGATAARRCMLQVAVKSIKFQQIAVVWQYKCCCSYFFPSTVIEQSGI